ncbi:hypothetical protein RHS01_04823 [Rhizoctonia solani]|uniref:Uncharacterized protein n=1 Tax=Rhizoctonia solani TaxID=456999 RepID=A0A8H7M7H4_9AGAM|nr:hypothetical protein RHS01_04823 [Rhizoctonia solani]
MPDNFQDYSYLSHPSPSGSSDSHSSSGDATAPFPVAAEFMDEMTEQELMECLANFPGEEMFPESQTIHPHLLQSFSPVQNILRALGHLDRHISSLLRPLKHRPPASTATPPPHRHASQLSQLPSVIKFISRPPGDTQRLSLPAPGDMNYSSCEVIM